MDKGTVSNIISASVLLLGLLIPDSTIQALILSSGMFAFSGGITNSLAVKMLFDRIPGLIGSGVIQMRFKEIRVEIKELIMKHFFNEDDLRDFLENKKGDIDWLKYVNFGASGDSEGPIKAFIEQNWEKFTSKESLEDIIGSQVDKLLSSSFGGFLQMVGRGTLEDLIGGFVESFATSMKEKVLEAGEEFKFDSSSMSIGIKSDKVLEDMRQNVDDLLEEKLQQLQPAQVKMMIEEVIRNHLGWLVVWGNIFGGLLGIAAFFVARWT